MGYCRRSPGDASCCASAPSQALPARGLRRFSTGPGVRVAHELGLVVPLDRLSEGFVVAVADRPEVDRTAECNANAPPQQHRNLSPSPPQLPPHQRLSTRPDPVDFAVYHAELTPLYAVDGNISGHGAAVIVTAANRTTEQVDIRYGPGAWGLDAAVNRIIPVPADWSAAGTINPRTQVGAAVQNRIVPVEQAAIVTSWASKATGWAVVEWVTAPPYGCAPRSVVTG